MTISVFDLFSIGVGPSSSHTVGPMRAARRFVCLLAEQQLLQQIAHITVDLYGSLALTGHGHATDTAILLGLAGAEPHTVDPNTMAADVAYIRTQQTINVLQQHNIAFNEATDLLFHKDKVLPFHANGMRFTALDKEHRPLCSRVYYSIGGGFVVDEESMNLPTGERSPDPRPYPFISGLELLAHCQQQRLSVAQIMWANEKAWRDDAAIRAGLLRIWDVMKSCIARGCVTTGMLPGVLKVKRRAPELYEKLQAQLAKGQQVAEVNWLSLYAIAVNEENAAGGQVVTAPTNGAAGTIPAVLNYYMTHESAVKEEDIITFLLTAAAIGILYKEGASISAAEVGCQGEVGVACSMAAAGLAAVLGGSVEQIENAAEIGMEHHLGLTCDPIAGLVQIPCIERNAMGAVQAVTAARLALLGDGFHKVSLDEVIATMRQTGKDMSTKYKETSLGGLAVNVPEC